MKLPKVLLNHHFVHVTTINPARNIDNSIKTFKPEKKYLETKELNKYGTGPFCRFSIPVKWSGAMGVYALFFDEKLLYIGQCIDLAKRYNQGYGQISPRACFKGGQSTNCKINKIILESIQEDIEVNLFFLETSLYEQIESDLINYYNPKYNSQKRKKKEDINYQKRKSKNIDDKTLSSVKQMGVNEVYEYLNNILANSRGKQEFVDIISGDIHRNLNLKNRMPTVCDAMYKLMNENDEVIYAPPKKRGSRVHIRYYL